MTINAIKCDSWIDAIQYASASGRGQAVSVCGCGPLVAEQDELDRLEAAGVSFAYLHDYTMADGSVRIVSVPVN